MSDREKAGLRGAIRECIEKNDLPDGSKHLTASEYSPDGRLLVTRTTNPDGSEWVTSRTYDSDGRLSKVISGQAGETGSQSDYTYDQVGRLSSTTNGGGERGRIDFHYDEQGRKTSVKSFDQKVLERAQNTASTLPPWDSAVECGIGVPIGGHITTIYDENDRPTEAQVHDPAGRLVSRFVRKYNENGQISEEKPFFENPALLLLDRFPIEQMAALTPAQISEFSNAMRTVMEGQAPAGTYYSYDTQGRVSKTRETNMMFEKTTTVIYNDHGDKAEERTTYADNSVIPTGVPHSIGEHGVLVPSVPAVEPPPSQPPQMTEVSYAYKYDSYGNWTQQTAAGVSSGSAWSRVRTRRLAYY